MLNLHKVDGGYMLAYTRLQECTVMRATAKLFMNGRSQAVRIPKEFAYEGVTELSVRKMGQKLILEPVRKSWLTLDDDSDPLGEDIMRERPDIYAIDEGRVRFE